MVSFASLIFSLPVLQRTGGLKIAGNMATRFVFSLSNQRTGFRPLNCKAGAK